MFGSESWYFESKDGRRWNWNKSPSFECPNYFARYRFTHPETGEQKLVHFPPDKKLGVTFARYVPDEVREAAKLLNCGADELAAMLVKVHQDRGVSRKRVGGKLTSECVACGGRLTRKGFAAWAEEPVPEGEETSEQRSASNITRRLGGGDGTIRRTTWTGYFDTKREAEEWAHESMKAADAALPEEVEAS